MKQRVKKERERVPTEIEGAMNDAYMIVTREAPGIDCAAVNKAGYFRQC